MPNPWDNDPVVGGKTSSPAEFAQVYGPAAERAAKALGVDPQILLGQWGLETGWGKSIIPGTNNLGNIKDFSGSGVGATDNMTGSRDKYRQYASPEDFADDFASLIQRKYPNAVGAKDARSFGDALKAGGYAEDPRYVDKVTQAYRIAGNKPNPVLATVGKAVESVIPAAQAAGNPWDNDPIVDAPQEAKSAAPQKRDRTTAEKLISAAAYANPVTLAGQALTGGDLAIGGARGLKDIVDTGAEYLAKGFDKIAGTKEGERVQAMNQAGREDFKQAYGDSTAAGVGRVAGNVVGTLPVGGGLGALARAAGAPRLGAALASGGFTTGAAPAATATGAAGNMLLRMLGGGATGAAAAGLIDPQSASTGAAVGAFLPPVARAAGAVGGAIRGVGGAAHDAMTGAGQQRIAASVLQRSATNPAEAAANLRNATQVVPGSQPTMAQVARDPGIAQLERSLLNNPETATGLQARYAQQRAARGAAVDEVAATAPNSGSYYDDIVEGRRVFANEDYAAARAAGIDPEMASSMQREIASLMERPSIQAAAQDARRLAAETGENITDMGSVQGLDWLKKALDNQISRANRGNTSIGAEDLRALMQTRDDLNATLEQLAPAYREANRNYAAMSRQVNSMDVARDLERRYTPASADFGPSAKEQGAAYMKALRGARESVRGATGRNMDLADAMSTQDIYALENVARDLARKEYAQEAGRAVGSPTAQNMLSQHLIERVLSEAGVPTGLVGAAQGSTLLQTLLRPVQWAGRAAEPRINNRLAELALSPEEAAAALLMNTQRAPNGALTLPGGAAQIGYRVAPTLGSR